MLAILLSILSIVSPIWPLGENPLEGDPYVIVQLTTHEMAFINKGEVKQVFDVAIGMDGKETPEGEFMTIVKAKDPYYRKMNIKGGDTKNPLGSRWIGIDAKETDGRDYGLHGTNRPSSIGQSITNGCVRLSNSDVEILYEEVPLGTKVLITSERASFEELAKKQGAIR